MVTSYLALISRLSVPACLGMLKGTLTPEQAQEVQASASVEAPVTPEIAGLALLAEVRASPYKRPTRAQSEALWTKLMPPAEKKALDDPASAPDVVLCSAEKTYLSGVLALKGEERSLGLRVIALELAGIE